MTAAQPRLRDLLRGLYGEQAAPDLLARLETLLDRWRPRLPSRPAAPLSEQDAFLIIYPDQVQEPGLTPLQSLADFCRRRLGGLISGIHLLPFYPSSSDDGFSVIDQRAVDPSLGRWEDIAELARSFRLMVDAVVNHASARSPAFRGFLRGEPRYRDFFIAVEGDPDLSRVVRPRAQPLLTSFDSIGGERRIWTTFSADQVDWNYHNPEVLLEILDVLLHLVWRGADCLRLDAIAYLWKELGSGCIHLPQTHAIVQLIRAVLDEVAPHVLLVSETNVPHEENVSYFGDGLHEAQLVYNFALPPLVLHAMQRQTAEVLRSWAGHLETPGENTAFLNFLASHDGVGLNPARGLLPDTEIEALIQWTRRHGGKVSMKAGPRGVETAYELNINYLDALCPVQEAQPVETVTARFLTAQAILLSLAGVPAVYFHSLVGSRGWPAGAERSGHNRAINREKMARKDLERELAEEGSLRARVFRGMASLLRARCASPAFHPAASQHVLDCGPKVFGLLRGATTGEAGVLCLHNVSAEEQIVRLDPALIGPAGGPWRDLLGDGQARDGRIRLGAWQTRWLVPVASFRRASSSREALEEAGR